MSLERLCVFGAHPTYSHTVLDPMTLASCKKAWRFWRIWQKRESKQRRRQQRVTREKWTRCYIMGFGGSISLVNWDELGACDTKGLNTNSKFQAGITWSNIGNTGPKVNLNSLGSWMPHVTGSTLGMNIEKTLHPGVLKGYPSKTPSSWGDIFPISAQTWLRVWSFAAQFLFPCFFGHAGASI